MKLSVIILTRNEAENIEACLETVNWADEIILIDDNSTDETIKIAQQFKKVKFFQRQLKDFADQHDFGQQQAKGDWLFYLDADERLSKALKAEIQSAVKQTEFSAFKLNRHNIFLGQWLKHGGWWPDRPTRLFKAGQLQGWQGRLHESAIVRGEISQLLAPLYHLGHRSLSQMLTKTIQWSKVEAELRLAAKHPRMSWWRVFKVGLGEFWRRLVKLQGWRDGMSGWLEVLYQSISLMITYLRLWELQL